MGVREQLNERPAVALGSVAAVFVVALLGARSCAGGGGGSAAPGTPAGPTKAFYSADDGKTWFVGEAGQITPFDTPKGKACRARVFSCPGGKPFVNHLERYPDAVLKDLNGTADSAARERKLAVHAFAANLEVKRPGESTWCGLGGSPAQVEKAREITTPRSRDCPSERLKEVVAE